MELAYSKESLELTSEFKSYRNSVNIYTEDKEEDRQFYVRLLGRLLDGTGCQINDITPLGSCHSVEQASKNNPDPKGVYIIDGDIYTILSPKQSTSSLYVLDAYCIENMVVDGNSVLNVAYCFYGKMGKEELSETLKTDEFMMSITEPLTEMFFHFALEQKHIGHFLIKHFNSYSNTSVIDRKKINNEIENIKSILVPKYISEQQFNDELNDMRKKYPIELKSLLKIVSGKNYLIPCIRCYISDCLKYKFSLPKESWKFNMANYCNLDRLQGLRSFILEKYQKAF